MKIEIENELMLRNELLKYLAKQPQGSPIQNLYNFCEKYFTFKTDWYRAIPFGKSYEILNDQKIKWRSLTQEELKELVTTEPQWKNEIRQTKRKLNQYLDKKAPRGTWRLNSAGLAHANQINPDNLVNYQDTTIEDIKSIISDNNIAITEKQILIYARIGQGQFRDKLIEYWKGCAVTGCNNLHVLKASHIKPWNASDNEERLDKFNGFLFIPNIDAVFDKGLITFKEDGTIIFYQLIDDKNKSLLNLSANTRIKELHQNHKKYLDYHREYVFRR